MTRTHNNITNEWRKRRWWQDDDEEEKNAVFVSIDYLWWCLLLIIAAVGAFVLCSPSLSLSILMIIMIIFNLIFNKFQSNGISNRIKAYKWKEKRKEREREPNPICAWLTLWYFNIIIIHIKNKHGVIGRLYAHYYYTLHIGAFIFI